MDDELDDDQYDTDGFEHQSAVAAFRQLVNDLGSCKHAWTLSQSIITSLEDLESDIASWYTSVLKPQFSTIEESLNKFRELISSRFVRDQSEISKVRLEMRDRFQALNQTRVASEADAEHRTSLASAAALTSKETRTISQGLKVEPPVFNGSLTEFQGYKGLFLSVIKKNTHLSDQEKNCLLLKSMGSADAKAKAEAAIMQPLPLMRHLLVSACTMS